MMRRRSCIHTLFQPLILAALALGVNQAQAQSEPAWNINPYAWSAQTVTAGERVRVIITKTKPKIHLARQPRPILLLRLNDDDSDYYDELPEFQVGYRRPELVNQTGEVDDLSDSIKLRLAIARAKAMAAYHANWS